MIKFVSVSASKVASKSSNAAGGGDQQKQAELNASIQELNAEIAESPDNDQEDWW
jgi:outer membrane murein-binding lipoprotein Lpp